MLWPLQARLISKERGVQEKLDQLRTNLAKIEESVQLKRSTIRECRAKVTSISHELTAIGSGAAALEGVDQELAGAVSTQGVWPVLSHTHCCVV